MKYKTQLLTQLNLIAQSGVPEKQVHELIYLVHVYASSLKNEIKGLNKNNVNNYINCLYEIISKY